MQKLIVKYGTAAHLALLAVAPLFLFPFCGEGTIATVMLWLSAVAAVWVFMEPSIRAGEMLHNARWRVLTSVVRDPLTWTMLTITLFAGLRALNSGVKLVYDAEAYKWVVGKAIVEIFPGVVDGCGSLQFAVALAVTVIVAGCRHALGRQARMAYLFVASFLAGLAAAVLLVMAGTGDAQTLAAIACPLSCHSFIGVAFVLHFIGAVTALETAFDRKQRLVIPLFMFSIGGTAAGAFSFLPVFQLLVFVAAAVVVLGYTFFHAYRTLPASGEFKLLVVIAMFMTLGGVLVAAIMPEADMEARLTQFQSFEFFTADYWNSHKLLSNVALKTWKEHIWAGTGIGSFAFDFRFEADAEAWKMLPLGTSTLPNGWLMLLAERGLVGAVAIALPMLMLLFFYGRNLGLSVMARRLPDSGAMLMPAVLITLAVVGVFDCSVLRADVMTAAAGLVAVSTNSFLRRKEGRNG